MATTRIDIEGNASGIIAELKKVQTALGSIQSNADSVSKSMNLIKIDSIINLAKNAWASSQGLMALADAATVTMNKMRSVSSSAEQANAAFSSMISISNKTGISVEAVGESFQKVALIAKSMGWTMNEARIITENMALAMKATGTAGPAAASAMYQLTQSLGRGVVAYEDLKQVQEAAAPVLDMIAKQFGMTSAEFLKAVQSMQVGSGDLKNAIIALGDDAQASIAKMAPTFAEAANKLRNSLLKTLDDIETRTGVFSLLAREIGNLGSHLDTILPILAAFAGYMAAARIAAFTLAIIEAISAIRKFGIAMAVTEALATGGIAAITGLAGAAAAYFGASALFDQFSQSTEGSARSLDALGKKIDQVNAKAPLKLEGPTVNVKALQEGLANYLQQYEVNSKFGVINDRRIEQEQAVLQYAKQNNLTYEKMTQNAGAVADKIREAVKQEQLRKAAMAIRGATPTGLGEDTEFKLEAARMGQREALRQNDLALVQQYADQELLIRQGLTQQLMELDKQLAEARALQRIQESTGSMFNYDTQKQMASEAANFEKKTALEKTSFVIDQGAQMFSALGAHNKKAFEAAKAFNIANAIMNTFMGVTKALATYPWPFNLVAAGATLAMGMAQVAQIRSQSYSGRALGGPVMGGQSYIVGESGPELFTPSTTGNITRNSDLGNNGPVNVNFSIQAVDAAGIDDLLIQRRGMITQFVRDAMQEQGQRSKM